ncbi:hypothetical protein G7083_05625 [Vibrio sp. HDW18]|uniref:hypothetical protein n=1 Tax=Vibrio sp. HDW18 TaxID=2714948 RepID=UPI001408E309|nr:hypothetical protein [Vibrio sp. HDW18]QIL85413.1 hypothetical protein G7083_05625 [Vibrio sp. HDW18]
MSEPLKSGRYLNALLRDRLAAEYVLGTQTNLVKCRMESLFHSDPTWWEHIEQWQQYLSDFNPATHVQVSASYFKPPPKRVWMRICERTQLLSKPSPRLRWWWLPVGMSMSLLVGIWGQNIMLSIPTVIEATQIQPIAYFAMMSSENQRDAFALVAYQGDKPGQSSLHMQRNLSVEPISLAQEMVWIRDKNTGELQLIDSLKNLNQARYLSPSEWQALKNSSELLVTINNDPHSLILYRGHCIELGS